VRCTKATLIYRRTKNLRAVQLLLGHTKLAVLHLRLLCHFASVVDLDPKVAPASQWHRR
jgi:site-specific recombinase XerC